MEKLVRPYLKMKKFKELLRKLVGGIKKEKRTTYNDSGKVIKVEIVTTKLSYFQIISKLLVGLMVVSALLSIFINIYAYYTISYFRPGSFFISLMFLMWLMWLYSSIGDD